MNAVPVCVPGMSIKKYHIKNKSTPKPRSVVEAPVTPIDLFVVSTMERAHAGARILQLDYPSVHDFEC